MNKTRLLTGYLYLFGIGNVFTSFFIPIFLGDMLLWTPRNLATDLMVGTIYFAMGIVMIAIAKTPENHKAFIDFLVLANICHAVVMLVWAQQPNHIYIDSVFIALAGLIPLLLYPWPRKTFLRFE